MEDTITRVSISSNKNKTENVLKRKIAAVPKKNQKENVDHWNCKRRANNIIIKNNAIPTMTKGCTHRNNKAVNPRALVNATKKGVMRYNKIIDEARKFVSQHLLIARILPGDLVNDSRVHLSFVAN